MRIDPKEQMLTIAWFKLDVAHGNFTTLDKQGNTLEGTFEDGKLHGPCARTDLAGKIVTDIWENGTYMRSK